MNKNKEQILRTVFSGVLLALCIVLPYLTANIPQIGSMLSPMHIPVLLCGFICGWPYGAVVGFAAPILRYFLIGMPPMPNGIAMAFELMFYGILAGVLYKLLPKKPWAVYAALIAAMAGGRVVWGLAMSALMLTGIGKAFTWQLFVAGAITNAIPGIILHIVLIPVLVFAMKKAKLMLNDK